MTQHRRSRNVTFKNNKRRQGFRGCALGNTQVRLGAVGGEEGGGRERLGRAGGGTSEQRGREELMKRGFVLLWAALGFSREFSHVAANSANVGSFIFFAFRATPEHKSSTPHHKKVAFRL